MNRSFQQSALKALIYEASIWPKPGLVDPLDHSGHPDMDYFDFIDSAVALDDYFRQLVCLSSSFPKNEDKKLFSAIRPLGIEAEKNMMIATNGANTHKGAVFSLGLAVSASAYLQTNDHHSILAEIKKMTGGIIEHDFAALKKAKTAGEEQYLRFGFSGARSAAQAGFPIVEKRSLPFLKKTTGNLNDRLLDTLLDIVLVNFDSNLLKRAHYDLKIYDEVRSMISDYFYLGGQKTLSGKNKLKSIIDFFAEGSLSLGGSADLLILTIYFALIEKII